MPAITFAELHDELTGIGLEVGIESASRERHRLVVRDGRRELGLGVRDAAFDRAAAVMVASMQLRHLLGDGGWPEFTILWR